jgi:Domain of unknown function (DUF5658)
VEACLTKDNVDLVAGCPENGKRPMLPLSTRKAFPAPSLTVFVALQVLDILTTLIGLRVGATEGSFFVGRLMRAGPVAALLIAKIMAVTLVTLALKFKRPRLVVFLNYWFAAVVTWNCILIMVSEALST